MAMTNHEQVVENNATSFLLEQLSKALNQLEAHKKADKNASEDRIKWAEIEEHFHNLETTFKKKIEELEAKEKEYEEKKAKTCALLAEREATVVAKEQDYLDRVQEQKDAATAVILKAQANHQPASLESVDVWDTQNSKVSMSLGDINSPEEYSLKMDENSEGVAANVEPRPELVQICEQMDAKGLLNFSEHQKNIYAIRAELSVALESAAEPAHLVLDSLEGFYPPVDFTQPMDKMDAALQGMRKSCVIFMEAMATILTRIDPGDDHLLNPEIKQRAKAIADEWKPKLASAGINATNGNSLEAEAFLRLLSTFRIASEFDEEELCELVLIVARRRQAPELCRPLGLTHKMPGVIKSLINSGRQIDAVHFIHAFQLTESFPPVPLLKAYLKDARRNSQRKGANSGASTGSQVDGNALEFAALKAVVGRVQEYKLEADYPLDPLQERLAQLDKLKFDKKRIGDFGRHKQSKKRKINNRHREFQGGPARGAAIGRQAPAAFVERMTYAAMPDRYPHTAPSPYGYQVHSQSVYGQQATNQRMYHHPQDDIFNGSSCRSAPSNYGSYRGTGLQSSYQPYM